MKKKDALDPNLYENLIVDPSSTIIRRRINLPPGLTTTHLQNNNHNNTTFDENSNILDDAEEIEEKWWTFRIPWLCGETDILVWGLGRVFFLLIGVYFIVRNYLSSRTEFIQEGLRELERGS